MKNIIFVTPLVISLLFASSCITDESLADEKTSNGNGQPFNTQIKTNLNISILLDLSDRISPVASKGLGMRIVDRDLGYIKSVSQAFETHLKRSKIVKTNDNIQVFFEPEPKNSKINTLSKELKLSFTKNNITKESIGKIVPTFEQTSAQIYNLALRDNQFDGSDIWKFFKNKAETYCIRPNQRNILVILTDGYLLHTSNMVRAGNKTTYLTSNLIREAKMNNLNYGQIIDQKKYGFIPAAKNLNSLEVMVLGINPVKGKDFEEDVIVKYWSDWFDAMGIKRYYIKNADLPSDLDEFIKNVILSKTSG